MDIKNKVVNITINLDKKTSIGIIKEIDQYVNPKPGVKKKYLGKNKISKKWIISWKKIRNIASEEINKKKLINFHRWNDSNFRMDIIIGI